MSLKLNRHEMREVLPTMTVEPFGKAFTLEIAGKTCNQPLP